MSNNVKLIIVEGANKTGKSSLLNEIRQIAHGEDWNILQHHFDRPMNKHAEHLTKFTEQFADAQTLYNETGLPSLILWDRSHISEVIYATLMRRNKRGLLKDCPAKGEFFYGQVFNSIGRTFVLVDNAELVAKRRSPDDPDIDVETELTAYLQYVNYFPQTQIQMKNIRHTAEDIMRRIITCRNKNQYQPLDTYIGPPIATGFVPDNAVYFDEHNELDYLIIDEHEDGVYPCIKQSMFEKFADNNISMKRVGFGSTEINREIIRKSNKIVLASNSVKLAQYAKFYLNLWNSGKILSMAEFISQAANSALEGTYGKFEDILKRNNIF